MLSLCLSKTSSSTIYTMAFFPSVAWLLSFGSVLPSICASDADFTAVSSHHSPDLTSIALGENGLVCHTSHFPITSNVYRKMPSTLPSRSTKSLSPWSKYPASPTHPATLRRRRGCSRHLPNQEALYPPTIPGIVSSTRSTGSQVIEKVKRRSWTGCACCTNILPRPRSR